MDCTIADWETRTEVAAGIAPVSRLQARALLRSALKVVYPVANDNPFADLVRAFDRPPGTD